MRAARPGRPARQPAVIRPAIAIALALLVSAAPARAADTDYHPPLNGALPVSSSFGEFRPNHFHGGIDFSTAGRIGLPVHAVADGWVWRVRASGSGYGRVLYVRLADGRTAVAAHLDRFAPSIAAFVAAAQESLARYEVDLSPPAGRLPVRRGEVIAWSGESGAGPPHLHFEMREGAAADRGINPRLLGFGDLDTAAPIIRRVVATPVGAGALVDGDPGPRGYAAVRGADGRYRLAAPIPVTGAVRFALDVIDPAPRDNRMAPHRVRLVDGDAVLFDASLDQFDWNRPHEVERWFDLAEADRGQRFVINLARLDGPPDAVYAGLAPGNGVIDPPPGPGPAARRLSAHAADLAGHEAIVDIEMVQAPVAAIDPTDATAPPIGTPAADLPAVRTMLTPAGLGVVVSARSAHGARAAWAASPGAPSAWWKRLPWPAWFGGGEASGTAPVPTALDATAPGRFAGLLPAPTGFTAWPVLAVSTREAGGGRHAAPLDTLDVVGLVRGGAHTVRVGGLTLELPDSAAFGPCWLGIRAADAPLAEGLVPVSGAWRLEAPGVVLDRPARLAIAPPAGTDTAHVGLYRRGSGAWSWVGNRTGADGIGGQTRYFGELVLARDTEPPIVTIRTPAARSGPARPTITVSIRDAGSGVTAATMTATIDDVPQLLVWDPEAGTLSGPARRVLATGPHRLSITVWDRAGNRVTADRAFRVGR